VYPPWRRELWRVTAQVPLVYTAQSSVHGLVSLCSIGGIRSSFIRAAGTAIQPTTPTEPKVGSSLSKVLRRRRTTSEVPNASGCMDRARRFHVTVVPYRETKKRGFCATRPPCRPNPIGMSAVTNLRRNASVLEVAGSDAWRSGRFDSPDEHRTLSDMRSHETGSDEAGESRGEPEQHSQLKESTAGGGIGPGKRAEPMSGRVEVFSPPRGRGQ